MVWSVMATEVLKYRRTLVPWLAAAGGFFPLLVALLYLLTGSAPITWESLALTGLGFMNMLALLLVAVCAGHAFVSEYRDSRVPMLFAYPVPRIMLYTVKLIVILLPVLGMYAVFGAFTVVSGAIFAGGRPLAPGFATDMLGLLLFSVAANYALVPMTVVVSVAVKNAGGYILAGICYFIVFMSFAGSELGRYAPPCVPDRLVKDYLATGKLVSAETAGLLGACAAAFLLMSCVGALVYARGET
jgi:bacitracin transport system permease protein